MGLILASFVFCLRKIKGWSLHLLIGLFFGALAAYALTETALFNKTDGRFAVEIPLKEAAVPLVNYEPERHLLTGLSLQGLSLLMSQGILQDSSPVYTEENN